MSMFKKPIESEAETEQLNETREIVNNVLEILSNMGIFTSDKQLERAIENDPSVIDEIEKIVKDTEDNRQAEHIHDVITAAAKGLKPRS